MAAQTYVTVERRAIMPPLLFDLVADPHETTNLATDPAMAGSVLLYAQKMLDWRLTATERTLTNMHVGPGGLFVRP